MLQTGAALISCWLALDSQLTVDDLLVRGQDRHLKRRRWHAAQHQRWGGRRFLNTGRCQHRNLEGSGDRDRGKEDKPLHNNASFGYKIKNILTNIPIRIQYSDQVKLISSVFPTCF